MLIFKIWYPGKPWMLYFYDKRCGGCIHFKPLFEEAAVTGQDIARWGTADGFWEELLKNTYKITSYPYILLLKNKTAYVYEGDRSVRSLRSFVTSNHEFPEVVSFPIPPKVTPLGLQLIYLERKLPKINAFLDVYLFDYIGFAHLEVTRKISLVVGGAMIIFGSTVIILL